MGGSPSGKRPYSRAEASIEGAGRAGMGRDGPGEAPARGGARPHGLGPGPRRSTPSLTHPRLPPAPDRPDHRDEGTLGPERPREDRWVGEGAGPSGRCGKTGTGRGGEKPRSRRSERPWEDCGTANPTTPQRETSGNFPAHLFPDACATLIVFAGEKQESHMRNGNIVIQNRGAAG